MHWQHCNAKGSVSDNDSAIQSLDDDCAISTISSSTTTGIPNPIPTTSVSAAMEKENSDHGDSSDIEPPQKKTAT